MKYKILEKDDIQDLAKAFNEELDSLKGFKDGNNLDSPEDYGDYVYSLSRLIVLGRAIHELKVYGETLFSTKILEGN